MKTLNIIKISVLTISLFFATACNKEEVPQIPSAEKPISSLIADANKSKADISDEYYYEFGTFFTPQKAGEIQAIILNVPFEYDYRVTLWDADTKAILKTFYALGQKNIESITPITPITLTQGKQYVITMNSNTWFSWSGNDNENLFPVVKGSISLDSYGYKFGQDQIFPAHIDNAYVAGLLDFVFQPAAE